MSDLLKRLKHFEDCQLKLNDVYGAELLANAQKEIIRLGGFIELMQIIYTDEDSDEIDRDMKVMEALAELEE